MLSFVSLGYPELKIALIYPPVDPNNMILFILWKTKIEM